MEDISNRVLIIDGVIISIFIYLWAAETLNDK